MRRKSVEFIKQWGGYQPGDRAGFPPDRAKALVEGRVAEFFSPSQALKEQAAAASSNTKTTKSSKSASSSKSE